MNNIDMVNNPDHYQTKNGLEAITVIEAFTEGLEGIEACDTGNVIKYILRWKKKNGIEDLEKTKWYLEHLIKHVKGQDIASNKIANSSLEILADSIKVGRFSNLHFICRKCGGNIVHKIRDPYAINRNLYSETICCNCGLECYIKMAFRYSL